MAEAPSAHLLQAFFDGRVYFSAGQSASFADITGVLCPPHFALSDFCDQLRPILEDALNNRDVVSRVVCNSNVSCEVRVLITPEGILATCASPKALPREQESRQQLDCLSDREFQVLGLLTAGMSNKQVAAELFLSPRTIEKHRAKIHQKTGTRSLALLTRLWIDSGYDQDAHPGVAPAANSHEQNGHNDQNGHARLSGNRLDLQRDVAPA